MWFVWANTVLGKCGGHGCSEPSMHGAYGSHACPFARRLPSLASPSALALPPANLQLPPGRLREIVWRLCSTRTTQSSRTLFHGVNYNSMRCSLWIGGLWSIDCITTPCTAYTSHWALNWFSRRSKCTIGLNHRWTWDDLTHGWVRFLFEKLKQEATSASVIRCYYFTKQSDCHLSMEFHIIPA